MIYLILFFLSIGSSSDVFSFIISVLSLFVAKVLVFVIVHMGCSSRSLRLLYLLGDDDYYRRRRPNVSIDFIAFWKRFLYVDVIYFWFDLIAYYMF